MSDLIKAILLGIVEGITEFLPISSTGHLILCERWMSVSLEADPFWKTFSIFIQIGAILAVVVYFRQRIGDLLFGRKPRPLPALAAGTGEPMVIPDEPDELHLSPQQRRHVLWMIALATIPVLVIGILVHDWVEANLQTTSVIASVLLIGGLLIALIEWLRPEPSTQKIEAMSWRQSLVIGLAQVLAVVFPGTSRSAATIMGGLLAGLSRNAAAEFSFFLAIPSMFAACGFSLVKYFYRQPHIEMHDMGMFLLGAAVAFLVAWAVIDWFMSYVRHHTFIPFAIYRIVLAMFVLMFS